MLSKKGESMKKTKIILTLASFCICLGIFSIGVLAASSISLQVNSSVSFEAKGVYVKAVGEILTGVDYTSENLSTPISVPEGADYNYTGYSYVPIASDGSNDTPNGSSSLSTMPSWQVGNVAFTEADKVIVYRLKFKNYSEFQVTATFDGLSDFAENSSFNVSYEGDSVSLPQDHSEVVFDIVLKITDFSKSVSEQLAFSISFAAMDIKEQLTFVPETQDSTTGYYTLEMGEYEGEPLVWKMILKETEDGVENTASYTADTELSGSYYFTLDTFVPELLMSSYQNNYEYGMSDLGIMRPISYSWITENNLAVPIDDYATSTVRRYLTGVNVRRGGSRQVSGANYWYIPAVYGNQSSDGDNFLDLFNIRSSSIYSMITPRTLQDLYTSVGKTYMTEMEEFLPSSTADKLWLISLEEANLALKEDSGISIYAASRHNVDTIAWEAEYWTRSKGITEGFEATTSEAGVPPENIIAIRPCFKLIIE